MRLSRTRTLLELRVGENAAVDVILYLRQRDLEWFNNSKEAAAVPNNDTDKDDDSNDDDDKDDKETAAVTVVDRSAELFQVLGQSVLPRMFPREIEESHYQQPQHAATKPPPLGPGGIPILAGEGKGKRKNAATSAATNNKKGTAKKKRGTTTATGSGKSKASKKDALLEQQQHQPDGETNNQQQKDVYYAFGRTLQLAYRCEDVSSKANSASFTFNSNNNGNGRDGGLLRELDKMPKRIVAWCFPFDPSNPSAPDPTDAGFPLPERIPIARLFRGNDMA